MVPKKPVKIIINALDLAKIIINVVIRYYNLPDSIVTNEWLLFISKFWLLLFYLLSIKRELFTTFYPQIDS